MKHSETIQVAGEKGLFHHCQGQLRRIAAGLGLSGNDADDVLQEVYLEAQQRPGTYSDAQAARHWLIRVTINRCRLEFRRQKRFSQKIEEIMALQMAENTRPLEPDQQLIRTEEVTAVRQALRELPESLQEPMVLRYFCGMNSQEIGQILELKPGAVRKRLCQGRLRLARQLLDKGINR